MAEDLARGWADVVARKDWDALRALVADDVDFRGMTPGRVWEGSSPDDVVEALGLWFEDSDVVESVELVETDTFADRQTAHYRLLVRNPDGLHVVDQTAYLGGDDRITWARVMCAGYRPVEG